MKMSYLTDGDLHVVHLFNGVAIICAFDEIFDAWRVDLFKFAGDVHGCDSK